MIHNSAPFRYLMLCAAVLSLSACGVRWPEWAIIDQDPFAFLSQEDKDLAPPPPADEALAEPIEVAEDEPATVGEALAQAGPVALAPGGQMGSFGLNLDTYLAQDAEGMSLEERVARLERVLAAMHRDMKTLVPVVQSIGLAATPGAVPVPAMPVTRAMPMPVEDVGDEDADGVPVALAPVGGAYNSGLPEAPPAGDQTPVRTGAQPAAVQSGQAVVTGVRVGEHPDKVRVVFDVSMPTSFTADLDNTENLLVVEMPQALWQMPYTSEKFNAAMPVVKSYKVGATGSGEGNIFVLQLKGPTQILKQDKLPALSGTGERIVIDLRK